MITQFYSKFDELHDFSVEQALSKSPNKEQIKKEIKYKIPERWTKKFHKYDIVPLHVPNAISEERGRVNRGPLKQKVEEEKKE